MSQTISVPLTTLAAEVRAIVEKFAQGPFHVIPDNKESELGESGITLYVNVILHDSEDPIMVKLRNEFDLAFLPAERLDDDLSTYLQEFPESLLRRLCDSLVQLPISCVIPEDDNELLADFDEEHPMSLTDLGSLAVGLNFFTEPTGYVSEEYEATLDDFLSQQSLQVLWEKLGGDPVESH